MTPIRTILGRAILVIAALALWAIPRLAPAFTFTTIDFPGATATDAFGINSFGDVVGFYVDASDQVHGFLRDRNGTFSTLDVPGATEKTETQAFGINGHGDVVGHYRVDTTIPTPQHGFLLDQNGTFTTIDVPGAVDTQCRGITTSGVVVGLYIDAAGGTHGFLRDQQGRLTFPIDVPGAALTQALGINTLGQVVGAYYAPGPVAHGFFRDKQGRLTFPIDVPVLGATDTNVFGINGHGDMVGDYAGSDGLLHGFLLDGQGTFSPIDVEGALATQARQITNAGTVVGFYRDGADVTTHGFIAVP